MRFFFYDSEQDRFKVFETEQKRDEKLLKYINENYVIDGIYDNYLIENIEIGVITHELKYKKEEIKENGKEWDYSPEVDSVGVYEVKHIKK